MSQVRVSHKATFNDSEWQEFSQNIELELEDSAYILFVQLSDQAGNTSETIEVDVPDRVNSIGTRIYLPMLVRP